MVEEQLITEISRLSFMFHTLMDDRPYPFYDQDASITSLKFI